MNERVDLSSFAYRAERMTQLARRYRTQPGDQARPGAGGSRITAGQAGDWPFILRTGTSPQHAHKRVEDPILDSPPARTTDATGVDEAWLNKIEGMDNLFPSVNYRYWAIRMSLSV
jgi:1,4-alpha-glucan branching enzyme